MGIAYDADKLSAAEACFKQASQLLYCEPNEEDIAAQVRERLYESAPYGTDDERVRGGLGLLDAWCGQAAEDLGDARLFGERVAALKREWFRLFIGGGTPEAPCWESYYVEPNSHLFGACTLDVRSAYRRHGLQIERLHSEPDDHLGLMLGFMGHLIGEEADAVAGDDESSARELLAEQEAFLASHMLPWLAVWRYAVEKHASSDYFRGVGEFAFGLCACYARRFGIVFDDESQTFKRSSANDEVA